MVKSVTDSLIYYSHHSSITDPGEYAEWFSHLPSEIPALCRGVQGIMLHHIFAELYNLELTEERMEEVELRHVTNLLARLLELDDQPLIVPRPPERRLAINCRDFATMLCAMLRHQGVPARARCGFAGYFRGPQSTPDFHVDHWVCEYWKTDEQRWVLVDAEVGETEREYCQVEVDTCDVPRDQFLVAGRAWQLCRSGKAAPDTFGLSPDSLHGLWYVQSQLVRDLAAMNKMELLCWDTWELGDRGPDDEVTAEEVALLDRVAALTQAGNEVFAELRSVYESNVCLRVPPLIKSYTKKGLRLVNIADSQ